MTVPSGFESYEEYVKDAVNFLEKYQFLYNYSNTRILVEDVFGKMLKHFGQDIVDNIEYIQNIDISTTNIALRGFLTRLMKLRTPGEVNRQPEDEISIEDAYCDVPLSDKKRHEIVRLSKRVAEVCLKTDCAVVVELGSGLGYLTQILNEKYNLIVLGLDSNIKLVEKSIKRQRKYHEKSIGEVVYAHHHVSSESITEIERLLEEHFGGTNSICLVGLHACADLNIDAMKIFLKMNQVKSLLVMPCCYHKLALTIKAKELDPRSDHCFINFPLSEEFQDVWRRESGEKFLRKPFLRLAAQPPTSAEQDHNVAFHLLSRSFLELYASQNNLKISHRKRRPVSKTTASKTDISNYITEAIKTGYRFVDYVGEVHPDPRDLIRTWNLVARESWNGLSRVLVVLQRVLQPVCENLVLLDRVQYLKENGFDGARFVRVTDYRVSPRCWALLVERNS